MLIAYILKSVKSYLEREATKSELSKMGDRALSDIGLPHREISKVARAGRLSRFS